MNTDPNSNEPFAGDPEPAAAEIAPVELTSVEVAPVFAEPWEPAFAPRVPEDLQVPWGAGELFLFLAFFILLAVGVAPLGVSLGMMELHISRGFVPHTPRETSIFLLANQVVLSAGIMLFLYLRLRLRYRSPFWKTLQWRAITSRDAPLPLVYAACVGGGCTLALIVGMISERLGKGAPMPIEEFFQSHDTALALMIMSVFMAPLVEETIFRGFLYPVLARRAGVFVGVLLTGILFGLMHSYQLGGNKGHVALLIVVGIAFTAVRAVSKTVLASFLVHISYNGFLAAGYLLSGTFHQLPPHH
jgi:membrane protease YdiL (CAAX protease family)